MAATSSASNSNNNLMASPQDNRDAWALLSLKEANSSMPSPTTTSNSSPLSLKPQVSTNGQNNNKPPMARISNKDFDFLMKNNRVIVGRNSNTGGEVDINMGHSSFISRKHIEIFHEDGNFFLICNGKNGVFVDGAFQCKGGSPLQLAKS